MTKTEIKPLKIITMTQYYMGRDELYPPSPQLRQNAELTVLRINLLLNAYGSYTHVTSGYRPICINKSVPGAAPHSLHITCRAIDLADPEHKLNQFCIENEKLLEELGLYLESPLEGAGHCHLQTVPPKSGNRIFIA